MTIVRARLLRAAGLALFGQLCVSTPSQALQQETGQRSPAPTGPLRGAIDGIVTDSTLVPIAGASIVILQSSLHVETLASGRFQILQVPAGQYLLVVRKVGFHPVSGIIEVGEGETVKLSYFLDHVPPTLDTMRVSAVEVSMKMTEFEERRRKGAGHFITKDEISRHNTTKVTDLVKDVLGFRVTADTIHSTRGAVSVFSSCTPALFVDGLRYDGALTDINLPSAKDIAGIELYSGAATAPLQYARLSMCGVILIWKSDGATGKP
ncbi:MAG: carboxypeptidase regulatory-like domain-containing protein [bacterium]